MISKPVFDEKMLWFYRVKQNLLLKVFYILIATFLFLLKKVF